MHVRVCVDVYVVVFFTVYTTSNKEPTCMFLWLGLLFEVHACKKRGLNAKTWEGTKKKTPIRKVD
jgi:hypothetical protein